MVRVVRACHFWDGVVVGWIGRGSIVVVIAMGDGRRKIGDISIPRSVTERGSKD
jgi:hypothetical protein